MQIPACNIHKYVDLRLDSLKLHDTNGVFLYLAAPDVVKVLVSKNLCEAVASASGRVKYLRLRCELDSAERIVADEVRTFKGRDGLYCEASKTSRFATTEGERRTFKSWVFMRTEAFGLERFYAPDGPAQVGENIEHRIAKVYGRAEAQFA